MGGVVGLHNAHLGSSITAVANVGIDVATGRLPQIQNLEQFITYAAKEVGLAIVTTAAAQIVGKGLSDIAKNWKWFERGYTIAGGGLSATEIKELGGLLQPSIIFEDAAAISARKGIAEFTEFEISQAGSALLKGGNAKKGSEALLDKFVPSEFDSQWPDKVNNLAADIINAEDWIGKGVWPHAPLEAIELDGFNIIKDGHHRYEVAKQVFFQGKIPYNSIPINASGYTLEELRGFIQDHIFRLK